MAVLVALAAFVSTLTGGVIASRADDKLHLILGAAAGIMLGVVTFDLLPEALAQSGQQVFGVPAVLLMAMAGFLSIHIVERSLAIHRGHEDEFGGHSHGSGHRGAASIGLLAGGALIAHSLLDGIGIGLGFQAGSSVGLTVAIAVIAHDLPMVSTPSRSSRSMATPGAGL